MTKCKNCNNVLSIKINKFCNSSCSAQFNNKNRSMTTRNKQKLNIILHYQNKVIEKYNNFHKLFENAHIRISNNTNSLLIFKCEETSNFLHSCSIIKIKIIRQVLDIHDRGITENDYKITKEIFENHLLNGMLPIEIQKMYKIQHLHFSRFLSEGFGLKPKLYLNKKLDEKALYKKECNFKFPPYRYRTIPGYDLLIQNKIYHKHKNPNGVHRDHIISKDYGWRNNISADIISHPANCQFLTAIDNMKKGSKSWMTVEELIEKINYWDQSMINN